MLSRILAIAVVGAVLALAGCNKCRELANRICDCKENIMRDNCKRNLDLQARHSGFSRAVDENFCALIIESPDCNCQAILNNEFDKCGMTRRAEGQ